MFKTTLMKAFNNRYTYYRFKVRQRKRKAYELQKNTVNSTVMSHKNFRS